MTSKLSLEPILASFLGHSVLPDIEPLTNHPLLWLLELTSHINLFIFIREDKDFPTYTKNENGDMCMLLKPEKIRSDCGSTI